MTTYLTIITTVLVLTQIIRITQNYISLRRQEKVFDDDLKITREDFEYQRKAYRLLAERLEMELMKEVEKMNDIEKAKEYFYNQMEIGKIESDYQQEIFEIAISALEKQIPKKPQEVDVDFSTFVCTNCLSTIMYTDEKETHNYCLKCGQKLDWRVEE